MSYTPLEHAESLRIGVVDFVSPDEIKVALDIEAPDSIALNAGGPRPFPRVNSYVLIPAEDGYLVGQVQWLTVERSAFPKRRGMQDFGLVDLPYPLRKMSLSPLGMLRKLHKHTEPFSFRRGADTLPSIGASVILPTEKQLKSIVESGENRRVKIGTSPIAGNAEVRIDPNRLFGRHLAVLGNTGSGKSCSVAGLIRCSIEQAFKDSGESPNARFIILDPNGEYSAAFKDSEKPMKCRVFKVAPDKASSESLLQIPIWFWNSAEWCSFTQASTKTQRPALIHALRTVRDGQTEPWLSRGHELRRFLRTIVAIIRIEKNNGTPWGQYPKPKSFFEKIDKWRQSLDLRLSALEESEQQSLSTFVNDLETLCAPRRNNRGSLDFSIDEVNQLLSSASTAHSAFGGSDDDIEPIDPDTPHAFSGESLLRSIEATAEMLNVSEYTETLLIRVRSLLNDARINSIISDQEGVTLESWLTTYVGEDDAANGCIAVLDLSLVPSEVVHIITSVIARIIFEALQRYRKLFRDTLPTVLVMEEAHTFVKRYKEDIENQDAASVCCQVFERIAREGRKFGLGLILSSQRPSELSPTVLAQCNTFLLHRISNDRDQELVNRLVPDNLKGLLRELPSLPSQNAILLGWASELPVLVKMNDLPNAHRPHSADPDFWGVWTRKDSDGAKLSRLANWKEIVDDWQGIGNKSANLPETTEEESPPVV